MCISSIGFVYYRIYNDKIDILIDLNGYTGHTGTFILARKPAPIQCIYMDYQNTSGLDTIDYILTDRYTIPEEEAEGYSETPAYIDTVYNCFESNASENFSTIPPCTHKGYVTFGVFNSTTKLSFEILEVWADIVSKVENSKIIFQYFKNYTTEKQKEIREIFAKYNVSSDRLIFPDNSDMNNSLEQTDLALDTKNFTGMTTSFCTLYRGVPIVTFEGYNATSRPSSRILRNLGLNELIAKDEETYKQKAIELANDTERLKYYRENMLSLLKNSVFSDYRGFTKSLEQTYKNIWEKYCSE